MTLVVELENPKGRLKKNEINSDKPGRGFSPADVQRHGYMTSIPPDEQAVIEFSRQIAARLQSARKENVYEDLILVADPAMIGLLRDAMDSHTVHLVRDVVTKNLSRFSDHELQARLRESFERVDRLRPLRRLA